MAYSSSADDARERKVAKFVESVSKGWNFHKFAGRFQPVDWYIINDIGRPIGWAEIKCRTIASTEYSTIFFAVRKYMALMMHAMLTQQRGFFFVGYTDCVYYIDVYRIDMTTCKVIQGGRTRQYRSTNDIEPIILLPVSSMILLKAKAKGQ